LSQAEDFIHQGFKAFRAEHIQGPGPAQEVQGSKQSGQSKVMVPVKMRNKNSPDAVHLASKFGETALSAFPAIDQEKVFVEIDQLSRRVPPIGREGGTAPQDEYFKAGHGV